MKDNSSVERVGGSYNTWKIGIVRAKLLTCALTVYEQETMEAYLRW